ncbi:g7615 [Coccomyxa viridis]|uniref:Carboxypeptidase n=1 Tax=Coccomyxa viridis TaxID=1274662 RepID=A0ABP1G2S3_9CHLO
MVSLSSAPLAFLALFVAYACAAHTPKSLQSRGSPAYLSRATQVPAAPAPIDEAYTKAAEEDRIDILPGWGKPDFGLFSGYVTVNESAGRTLFYSFAESKKDKESKPLVLWLNGGPGCSSLASGFLSELGPFYPTADGKLQENKYTWTQAANIIFLESPAFVGWSYSNTSSDIIVGDARTANDALKFLQGFMERFPAYQGRPFWIAGESYGGHYVPNLALAVVKFNEVADASDRINIKGFMAGNAWTDPVEDNKGAVDFWYSHALISEDTRDGIFGQCNFSRIGPLQVSARVESENSNKSCNDYLTASQLESGFGNGGVNIYDIFADVCGPDREVAVVRQFARVLGTPSAKAGTNSVVSTASLAAVVSLPTPGAYDPCIDNEVTAYFNRPDVQQAFHANSSGNELPYAWESCSSQILYSRTDLLTSMLPKYKALLDYDLSILVFSGDVDAIVPVTGTRRWLRKLGLPVKLQWRPWKSATGQVGGYYEVYDGLTFATVRDAGHMVPYTQPERALFLFTKWVTKSTSVTPDDSGTFY